MRLCLQDFNPCIAPLLQESKLGNVFSQSKPFFSISQHNRVDLIVQRFLHPSHLRRDQPPKYLHRYSCCRSALGQNTPRCTTPFSDTFHLRHRVPSRSFVPLRSSGLGSVNHPFPDFKSSLNTLVTACPQYSFNTQSHHHPFYLPARCRDHQDFQRPSPFLPFSDLLKSNPTISITVFENNLFSRNNHYLERVRLDSTIAHNNHYLELVTVACRIYCICSLQQQYDIHVETAKIFPRRMNRMALLPISSSQPIPHSH